VISVDEARALVRERARPLDETESLPLADAAGRVLAGTVCADRDDPPFHRSMMDGYALRAKDMGARTLRVVGRVAAGDARLPAVPPGCAVWINTGAPLPPETDTVVPVELTRGEVEILSPVAEGANVMRRGVLAAAGEPVADGLLTPEVLAVCAAQGADPVTVRRRPRVAVLSTGTELRDAPGAHEIRNSNGPLLVSLLAPHYDVVDLGVSGDDPSELDAVLNEGLQADVLVTTGGVSKGELDLVRPGLLARGVEIVFHGIALQPGKPVLFGCHEKGAVFALPGNPASALVCADLFLLPYLAACAGRDFDAVLASVRRRLTAPVKASPKRRRVFPCVRRGEEVEPLPWRSSADIYTLARCNGYTVIELGRDAAAGDDVTCLVPERFAAR